MPATKSTGTKRPAIETKALAADTKSEGMRMLYDAGYTVANVAKVFGVGYPFAYGVAQRHGVAATAANRKSAKAKVAKATKVAVSRSTATKGSARKTSTGSVEQLTPGQKAYRARKARQAARPLGGSKTTAGKIVTEVVKAAPVRARATKPSRAAKVAEVAAKVAGRPSPARRAANRKPRAAKA